jgi:hypothetical protein
MATADELLKQAQSCIGVTEEPANSNRTAFAALAGHANGQPWCATFVVACARRVGLKLPSESAYTPTMADGFKNSGRWFVDGPERGDIVFFDFPDGETRIQHVGIVEAADGNRIRTVEGNTSAGDKGSQDNGGGVFEKSRNRNVIVGFGRPAFADQQPTQGQGTIVSEEDLEMGAVIPRPQGGYIVVQNDGGVFTYEGAPFHGSIPGQPEITLGGNVVGGAWTESGEGYWLLAKDGAVYSYGDATYAGAFNTEPPEVRGGRYAVGMVRRGPQSYRIVTFDPRGDDTRYDHYDYG